MRKAAGGLANGFLEVAPLPGHVSTMCLAPQPEFLRALEEIREIHLPL
jgi:hypothetical protein